MREIVSSLGEEQAREFEGYIANDRCAYYLTKLTIGGPALLTRETGLEVFEELRKRVAMDAESEAARKYKQALLEKDQELALKIDELSAGFTERRNQAEQALEAEKKARADIALKLEEFQQAVKTISEQHDTANAALITLAREVRRRVEFTWSLAFAIGTGLVGFSVGPLGTQGGLPLWVSAALGIVCGAAGFHVVPNYIFGGFIEKRGERAFITKASGLGIAPLAQEIMEKERIESRLRSK